MTFRRKISFLNLGKKVGEQNFGQEKTFKEKRLLRKEKVFQWRKKCFCLGQAGSQQGCGIAQIYLERLQACMGLHHFAEPLHAMATAFFCRYFYVLRTSGQPGEWGVNQHPHPPTKKKLEWLVLVVVSSFLFTGR